MFDSSSETNTTMTTSTSTSSTSTSTTSSSKTTTPGSTARGMYYSWYLYLEKAKTLYKAKIHPFLAFT